MRSGSVGLMRRKSRFCLIQEPEMESGCDVVTHQKWSGANYMDNMLKMVTGGVSSTSAMGKGVTEEQFAKKH